MTHHFWFTVENRETGNQGEYVFVMSDLHGNSTPSDCGADLLYPFDLKEPWFSLGVFDMKDGNDFIYGGTDSSDIILLGPGNDFVKAFGGDKDIICGGDHSDELMAGYDGEYYLNSPYLHRLEGRDELYGEAGDDYLKGTWGRERLHGGDGNDNANNYLGGGAGNLVVGGLGDDDLFGGDDIDVIVGGPGSDTMEGWGGDDVLFGTAGVDELRGDEGDDWLCYFGDAAGVVEGGEGRDLLCMGGVGTQGVCGTSSVPDDGLVDECCFNGFSTCQCVEGGSVAPDVVLWGWSAECASFCDY